MVVTRCVDVDRPLSDMLCVCVRACARLRARARDHAFKMRHFEIMPFMALCQEASLAYWCGKRYVVTIN